MATGKPDINNRIVAHFPGFEPLDYKQHHERYRHAASTSSAAFAFKADVSGLVIGEPAPSFSVSAAGSGWRTGTSVFLLSHYELIEKLRGTPALARIWYGYKAAFYLIGDGTFGRYLRTSWRYALYFLFPFVALPFFAVTLLMMAALPLMFGLSGVHGLWSVPAALLAYRFAISPVSKRLQLPNLFDQWRFAQQLASMDRPEIDRLVDSHSQALRTLLSLDADDRTITAHSLGGVFAILALGRLLETDPTCLKGKNVTLITLAGSGLQVSLIRRAKMLRSATRQVLECPEIYWLDYQCLADPVNLFGSKVAPDLSRLDSAFEKIVTPPVVTIRVRDMLELSHYRRIRWDKLRLHRQFVLGSDRAYRYDFISLTAGPYASCSYAAFSLATESTRPVIDCTSNSSSGDGRQPLPVQ